MIAQKRLKELLHYDPESGNFTRRILKGGQLAGTHAGSIDAYGYICIALDRRTYKAHRLAWLYMYGVWPELDLDHKNENKTDNRIANLREASKKNNTWNVSRPRKDNVSKWRGVSKHNSGFQAGITVDGKQKYLGLFKTPEAARDAYLSAKNKLHAF